MFPASRRLSPVLPGFSERRDRFSLLGLGRNSSARPGTLCTDEVSVLIALRYREEGAA